MTSQPQMVDIDELSRFLLGTKWEGQTLAPLSADMGLRRYYRVEQGGQIALLMDMSRAGILEIGLQSYLSVGSYLSDINIRTPEIYRADAKSGLALIESLGTESFGDALKKGVSKNDIYAGATEVLVQIKQGTAQNDLNLSGYKETLIYKRLGQFVDYYMPIGAGRPTTQSDHDEFHNIWFEVEKNLPPCPMGFCHADYHLENLMWKPNDDEAYGLIDFQDAFWGFQGYDLLNLLEDARADVPDDIRQAMKARYCEDMYAQERQAFDDWYSVLSAQFHCRVIGLFIKFSAENTGSEFLSHIPRLQQYLTKNLENPVLSPLKDFVQRHNISLRIPVNL